MNIDAVIDKFNEKIANLPPVVIRLIPLLIWLGLVVIHLPLLIVYTRSMLSFDHYESLPLLWLVFAGFLVIRTESIQLRSLWQSMIVAGLLMLDAGLLFVAARIYSPWLAYIGLVIGSTALLAVCKDRDTGKTLIPLALLLLVGIRLPLSYDTQLINDLQLKTSATSSLILNELGYLHYRAGNTLEVGGVSLFVEEACSGVQSLFTLIVCSAFLVIYLRRHWLHATFLFVSAWLWAGLMNTVRVSAIAMAQGWYQYDLTSGWQHDLLGYACLLLAFLFLLSTDQVLYFIFGPIVLRRGTKEFLPNSLLSNLWNRVFSRELRLGEAEEEVMLSLREFKQLLAGPVFAITLMGLIGIAQAWTIQKPVSAGKWSSPASHGVEEIVYPVEMLPATIGEWQLTGFKTEERDHRNVWARRSSLWTYQRGSTEVEISFNYPYHGWKRLQECYEGIGWHITEENVVLDNDGQPWMDFALANKLGQNQYIMFTMFNNIGVSLSPPEGLLGRVKGFQSRVQRAYTGDVSYMVQARSASHTAITPQAIDDIRKLGSQIAGIIQKKFKQNKMKGTE